MITDEITKINALIVNFDYLEIRLLSFSDENLILAVSADFAYYHNFEIKFYNVFTMNMNTSWRVDVSKNLLTRDLQLEELININKRYSVETGNTVFKLVNEDDVPFYVIAKDVELIERFVKYY